MKLKVLKSSKDKPSMQKGSKETGADEAEKLLSPQRKLLSFTRSKDRKPKAHDAKATTGPDLEDFRDLIDDDDDEPVPEVLPSGSGFPRRSRSQTQSKALTSSQSMPPARLDRPPSRRRSETAESRLARRLSEAGDSSSKSRVSNQGQGIGDEVRSEKPLPKLLTPRISIAETVMAASKATSQAQLAKKSALGNSATYLRGEEVKEEDEGGAQEEDGTGETQSLTAVGYQETGKKKTHKGLGHIWKVVKNDLMNPKAAAENIQAISLSAASMSVTAAKSATSAMNSVATRVESDLTNIHDQILGGKRNLPDHSRELLRTPKIAVWSEEKVVADKPDVKGSADNLAGSAANLASKAMTATPTKSDQAAQGLTVQKSKGSAYMLSKYEEEEDPPEATHILAGAVAKTTELITHGTGAMLTGANGGARYLRRMLMCGIGGRQKD